MTPDTPCGVPGVGGPRDRQHRRAAADARAPAAGVPLPPGWRLAVRDSVPSTSTELVALAAAGETEGLALLARRQTGGRGRDGRLWESPEGNLFLSVLLRPAGPVREAAQWSLLAGVALAEAAAATDREPPAVRLKWPNDLLRHGAKAGGILADGALAPGNGATSLAWLVLGFGVNLAVAPRLPDRPTAILPGAGPPEAFATRLLRRLDHWRGVQAAEGFGPVRAAWMALGPTPGEALVVRVGGGAVLAGRYAGLAEDGSLLLDTDDGPPPRRVAAGEVTAAGTEAG